jgi:hypothetical protein
MTNAIFICAALAGVCYFLFRRRIVDALTVAFGGAVFYFLPLIFGRLPPIYGAGVSTEIVPGTYAVALVVLAAIVSAAIIVDLRHADDQKPPRNGPSFSGYYLTLSVAGLIIAMIVAPGKLFIIDKAVVLENIGYAFVLFETGAALACIDAAIHRRWWHLLAGMGLLFIDLIIGFRLMTLMTAAAIALVKLGRQGRLRAIVKVPTYGVLAAVLFISLFSVPSVRKVFITGPVIAGSEPALPSAPATATPIPRSGEAFDQAIAKVSALRSLFDKQLLSRHLSTIEPFTTQAILNEIIRHSYSCNLKEAGRLLLLLPIGKLGLGYYGSFEDEFRPALFPDVTWGLAANIWAEMLCRYGHVGFGIFLMFFVASLVAFSWALRRIPLAYVPPLALAACLWAFYIHRNELYFELLLLRRCVILFLLAWMMHQTVIWLAKRFERRGAG